ncbi:MAG TPA: tRNA (adenosine(37)-N6)-threonylcarbamoyltransferase complex ATPase subunit type 1 TsaE [Pyrinomonadaceae bacterium]|jgi:tRNA threonylcarbamoyl adenosine modification protein YjeE|nr:tRNA (adenosine(37)-N6)-threonylcarbamoyltransferase complex ATPase subunit type 1 TsaE [Pyrinomonadaceae bacterium]
MNRTSATPEETFELGRELGESLRAGDVVLLYGGLGAGKTLLTKGVLDALEYDVDEVTSPSFTLVNLYKTPKLNVYHIDLWRIEEGHDAVTSVGLDEILEAENSAVIIEWAERLGDAKLPGNIVKVAIDGDGEEPRSITVSKGGGSGDDLRMVIQKAERRLDLLRAETIVRSFNIALGFEPVGDKIREGDGKTPEGEFFIFARNPESRHELSLAISYPDVGAARRGVQNGVIDQETHDQIVNDIQAKQWIPQETPLGGRIYIHGGGCDGDWTDGCIAVRSDEMRELYEAAFTGMKVIIQP